VLQVEPIDISYQGQCKMWAPRAVVPPFADGASIRYEASHRESLKPFNDGANARRCLV